MPAHWQEELILIPLVGGALSLDGIGDGCVPGGSLGAGLLRDMAVIPPGLLFALGLLSADGWGQIFPEWSPPEKGTLMNISEIFASNVLSPQ